MPDALAFRYARALADLVFVPASGIQPEEVVAELVAFEEALAASPDLKVALESPTVPPARKRAVIERLSEFLPLSGLVRRFLFVLTGHRRTSIATEVREAFEAVADERLGIARADVTSARPLPEVSRQEITTTLTRLTGREIRARFRVDGNLIGGVVARIGSTVYDGSIRGQLEGMKRKLAGADS
jgi:F-type H+-transporting ATPase subunit delta